MVYSVLRNILSFLYRIIYRIEVTGEENIPKSGGAILCANHKSNNDGIILAISQKRPITFMAKEELFKIPVLGTILKKVAAFPVKRGTGDIGAIRTAVDVLNKENMLSIFPEGTRNKTKEPLGEFKAGAVLIAYKADSMIVPCAISGSYIPFSKIKVSFGVPFKVEKTDVKPDLNLETSKLKEKVFELMNR